jgi:Holliday junction resolvase
MSRELNNRHMNVFEAYGDKHPLENNISRGLAIVFDSYPSILDRFIDLLNENYSEKDKISKPDIDNCKIEFQFNNEKIVHDYPDIEHIYAIALTASNKSDDTIVLSKNDETHRTIPDILIAYESTAIIIEVKKNAADARSQVINQAECIEKLINKESDEETKACIHKTLSNVLCIDLSWSKLMGLIINCQKLYRIDDFNILSHYIQFLTWYDLVPLNFENIDFGDEQQAKLKIALITDSIINENSKEKYDRSNSASEIKFLKNPYADRATLWFDSSREALCVGMWFGDIVTQCRKYIKKLKVKGLFKETIVIDKDELLFITNPKFRLARFRGNGVIYRRVIKNEVGDTRRQWENLLKPIVQQHKKDGFKILTDFAHSGKIDENTLCGSGNRYLPANFDEAFEIAFANTSKINANVTFECLTYIPKAILIREESNDTLSEYIIKKVIPAIIKTMVDE